MPILIITSVLTVYMTVILAHNLEFTIHASGSTELGEHPLGTGWTSRACMIALVLLSIFPNGHWDVLEPFVTMEDKIALCVLLLYVIYHTIR